MNWKCWTLLAVVAAIVVAGLWFSHVRQAKWFAKDAERVAMIDSHKLTALDAERKAHVFAAQAAASKKREEELKAEVERLRKWRKNRKPPKTLPECKQQLVEYDASVAILERQLAIKKLTVIAQEGTIVEQRLRGDHWEYAWGEEHKRSETFKKVRKREKMKKVFIGVGSGIAGGILVGVAVGATN
jgi:hypothetical protein